MIGVVSGGETHRETERQRDKGSQGHQKLQSRRKPIPRKKLEALVELLNAEASDLLCGY